MGLKIKPLVFWKHLDREPGSAGFPASFNNISTGSCLHPGQKAVLSGSFKFLRLIGPLG